MTLTVKLLLIAALVLSIIIPFGYFLIGEKNKKRYKRAVGANVFFFYLDNAPALREVLMAGISLRDYQTDAVKRMKKILFVKLRVTNMSEAIVCCSNKKLF